MARDKDKENNKPEQQKDNVKEDTQTKEQNPEMKEKKGYIERENENVEEELENIKDLVQTEVNNILKDSEFNDWNELVSEAKKEKDDKKPKKNTSSQTCENMCERCGKNKIDTSENPNSYYCKECREKMKEVPFNWKEILAIVVAIALLFVSSWRLSKCLYTFKTAASAHKCLTHNELSSAANLYDDVNSQFEVNKYNYSKVILNYEAELYYKKGMFYYENINQLFKDHYKEKDCNFKLNPKVKKIKKSVDEFEYTKDKVMKVYEKNQGHYDKFLKEFDAAVKKDSKHTYDKGMIYFWKHYVSAVEQQDVEVQLKWLKKMEKETPEYKSTFLPVLGQTYLQMKDYKNVIKTSDKSLLINSQDTGAYRDKAIAYRMQKDYDNAAKTVKAGLKIDAVDADLNHQMSILKLLDNDKQQAFSFAKLAYESNKNQYYMMFYANVYATCAKINNDDKTYEELEEQLSTYGMKLSEDIPKLVDAQKKRDEGKKLLKSDKEKGKKLVAEGDKVFENVFTKGEGELKWN